MSCLSHFVSHFCAARPSLVNYDVLGVSLISSIASRPELTKRVRLLSRGQGMAVGTDVTLRIWYDDEQDVIKMRVAGELTSMNNNPASKRGNPSLYKKLAKVLRDAGEKYPSGIV